MRLGKNRNENALEIGDMLLLYCYMRLGTINTSAECVLSI